MKRTVYIHQQPITLEATDLIQAGGEGMVFAHKLGAIKLYHKPQQIHAAKLRTLCQTALPLPANILAPNALVTNASGQIIGLRMPLLPAGSRPFRKLASLPYRAQHHISQMAIISLLQQTLAQLMLLHQQGFVVGDLNDTNLFFVRGPHLPPTPFWIDVDSFQYGQHPCPAAMHSFLDPALYAVKNFRCKPVFSQQTDWYAFSVLLVKCLLGVHPFGGTHHQYKSLATRALARVSILHPGVTLPTHSLPLESLSDGLLQHIGRVFDHGERGIFPTQLLNEYAGTLIDCPHCGLSFPKQRRHCPRCRQRREKQTGNGPQSSRPILIVEGTIIQVAVAENGRFQLVTRQGDQYFLTRAGLGGKISETALFSGQPGYRFAIFGDILAVNPPLHDQLLLLDLCGKQPAQLQLLTTTTFRGKAVFAATTKALYRIAGGWIMRGIVRDGLYVEDYVCTAHRAQTRFWAAKHTDAIGGYHRIFDQYRFFNISAQQHQTEYHLPPLSPAAHVITANVVLSPQKFIISVEIKENGRRRREEHTYSPAGDWLQTKGLHAESEQSQVFHWHPRGKLIQKGNEIWRG
jgi:H/ACA ribonucleoprotein complex subunit 3